MECNICGKSEEETVLSEGIFEEKILPICKTCSIVEGIPLIKKSVFREDKKENLSVRERIERLSETKKTTHKEQAITYRNLSKLTFPNKREDHPHLVENYDWILKTARRRKKISQTQLAEELIVPLQVIVDLESGRIAKDFMIYLDRIENFLEVTIQKSKLESSPREILESMGKNKPEDEEEIIQTESNVPPTKESMKKWTLKDLINFKRRREASSDSE